MALHGSYLPFERHNDRAAEQCVGTDEARWCARFAGSRQSLASPLNAVLSGPSQDPPMIVLAFVAFLAAGPADRLVEVRNVLKIRGRGAASFLFSDDQRWDRLLRDIATGHKDWLAIAAELRAGADGGAGETLTMAMQEALPRNPVGVLRLVSLGRFDVGVCGNYGFGQIEDERPVAVLLGLVAKRVEAVSRVKSEELRAARTACLDELAKLRVALKGTEPDNNGLEQTGREGVALRSPRPVFRVAPRSSTQCYTTLVVGR